MTAGGGALAGSLAGPLGTVAGAALGIGIDYTVSVVYNEKKDNI